MKFSDPGRASDTLRAMAAEDRDALAAELKRALASLKDLPAKRAASVKAATSAAHVGGATALAAVSDDEASASISFTMPLLRAVLAGHKTQTRRPVRPIPSRVKNGVAFGPDDAAIAPLCGVGGRLWVREKWARIQGEDGERFAYAIDEPARRVRWNSSRFMPRAAARHFLRVDAVAIARLCAIDAADARREGAAAEPSGAMFGPRAWFLSAWDAIYGSGEFASRHDPWVWVIDFRLEGVTP